MTKARGKRCSGHVERKKVNKNAYTVLMTEHESKRTNEKPRHIEGDNIKQDSNKSTNKMQQFH